MPESRFLPLIEEAIERRSKDPTPFELDELRQWIIQYRKLQSKEDEAARHYKEQVNHWKSITAESYRNAKSYTSFIGAGAYAGYLTIFIATKDWISRSIAMASVVAFGASFIVFVCWEIYNAQETAKRIEISSKAIAGPLHEIENRMADSKAEIDHQELGDAQSYKFVVLFTSLMGIGAGLILLAGILWKLGKI